jgi:hypothetical protein
MVSEKEVLATVQSCNEGGRTKTFAEFIAQVFDGKFIEIYLSDSYEEVSMEQISQNYPAVFVGKVIGAYRECLILNSIYINKSQQMQLGNMMFLSERAIKAINEVDGNGTIEDMFLRSRESLIIKDIFIDGKAPPPSKASRTLINRNK